MGASAGSVPTEAPRARSALESVVVHASGAVCTRRARLDLPPTTGTASVRIDGLPPTLYERSLRGRVVSGPPGLRVTDVRIDLRTELRRAEELPRLRLDLEDAQDRRSRLRDRCARLRAEIEEVAGFRAEPPQPRRGDPPRWAPIESILALAGFVDSRLALLHERLTAAEDESARADHDADVLEHRLHQASSALSTGRTEPSFSALLTLARDDDGPPGTEDTAVELELEYHVPGATWAPVYQLRLDGSSGDGVLVLRACVAQRTGEDWTGVRLGLSTADLLRRPDLPELRSLRIGRSQRAPANPGWREPPPGLEELFAGYDAAVVPRTSPVLVGGVTPGFPALPPSAVPPPPPAPVAAEAFGYGGTFGGAAPGGPPPPPAPQPALAAGPPPAKASHGAVPTRSAGRARRSRSILLGSVDTAADELSPSAPAAEPVPEVTPAEGMLDYARLVLAGPDAPAGRGTLGQGSAGTDPVVAEYRRRADEVRWLTRPRYAADVRASAGSFDYRFDTATPVDVEADGGWHTVPVCEVRARMESEYVCVPSVDPAVYGTVQVTNASAHALLAGPADVVVDGDFVLTAPLPTLAPGERQAVGTGVVESVQVARRTHMRESTAGLRGGTTVLDHTVEVEVANRLPHPVVVEVRERIPVSTDKDVRIEEHRTATQWTAQDEPPAGHDEPYVRGARAWRVALEPGRMQTLTGGFEIRLPAGKAVVGGNRRN